MYKKKIKYVDYNGCERSEDFYFNITKAEAIDKELSTPGGYFDMLKQATDKMDRPALASIFKQLVLEAYGEKSADGRYFYKEDPEGHKLANNFKQTEAYSILYMELATNASAAAEFVNHTFPKIDPEEIRAAAEAADGTSNAPAIASAT